MAGLSLSPYRLLLLVLFVPLFLRWISGRAGRITAADIFILLNCAWMFLVLMILHGKGQIPRGGILFAELFGGYLVGRTLIRNAFDHKMFFRYFVLFLMIVAPFAIVEMVTGQNILRLIFEKVFSIPPRQINLGRRLGLVRAQGPFEHPILFGLFCSLGVANVFYIYKGKFFQQSRQVAFLVMLTFTTLSSAPLISVGLQLAMCSYDRLMQFVKARWVLLFMFAVLVIFVGRIASEFHLLDFVINNLTFEPAHGDGRLEILKYGLLEVERHPIFGIGLNDWVRPYWRPQGSLDNFWLALAMRYGIPSFVFLVLGIVASFVLIISARDLSEPEARYRAGYLFALIGLIVVLGTVYMWGATSVFVMTYLGAGSWFYTKGSETELATPGRARDPSPRKTPPPRPAPIRRQAPTARQGGHPQRR